MAEINLKTLTPAISEIDVNFNGTLEGQADATIPLNVNLTDGVSDITPTSVALTGNDLDITIVPSGVLFKTVEPSQYTSYRTGDEGWRAQNGWFNYTPPTNPKAVAELDTTTSNMFFVLKNPLVVNGVSSTTRFVDVNGVQVFTSTGNANQVVIDKLTGLMYRRIVDITGTWNNSIDFSLNYSIVVNGITYDDWYLPTLNEHISFFGFATFPFLTDTLTSVSIYTSADELVTATTQINSTTRAQIFYPSGHNPTQNDKSFNLWKGTSVRNARNLITAP